MTNEVRVPTLPESVADATVLTWHKKPGEAVRQDENLVDLETDKVVLEVPSPAAGVLKEILRREGEVVGANEVLAIVEAGGAAKRPAAAEPASAAKAEPKFAAAAQAPGPAPDDSVLAPGVRRLVKELNVDPTQVEGSGKGGRILKSDVMKYLDAKERSEPERDVEAAVPQLQERPPLVGDANRPEQRVTMTRLRARIAERLVQAQQTAAILTTFNEVNLQAVNEIRSRYREGFEKKHGVRLGFMSFFIKAVVEALQQFPIINASVDGQDILYHGYYDIGVAVSSPRGLVVPILKNCDQLSFGEIEKAIMDFGQRAREGGLSYEELSGGTFTITNGGVFGSLLSTPILNPPQSAILGMHKVQDRPMVENGQILIRPMMYLALSYDHRIIDGRDAVSFLVTVKQGLEDPARLLLGV
jgi:2-oxoglutarate dehydrogenase E2 component (dihydrolipoamide succinyltransferase)